MRARGTLAALVAITAALTLTSYPQVHPQAVKKPTGSVVPWDNNNTERDFMAHASRSRVLAAPAPRHQATIKKTTKVHKVVLRHRHRSVRRQVTPIRTFARVSVSRGTLKGYAASLVGSAQFSCLEPLWEHESGWSVTAGNRSGAYGIPQALPGSKMASAGSDWRTNGRTQIRWGIGYIAGRYGNACSAYAHWRSHNWY